MTLPTRGKELCRWHQEEGTLHTAGDKFRKRLAHSKTENGRCLKGKVKDGVDNGREKGNAE